MVMKYRYNVVDIYCLREDRKHISLRYYNRRENRYKRCRYNRFQENRIDNKIDR